MAIAATAAPGFKGANKAGSDTSSQVRAPRWQREFVFINALEFGGDFSEPVLTMFGREKKWGRYSSRTSHCQDSNTDLESTRAKAEQCEEVLGYWEGGSSDDEGDMAEEAYIGTTLVGAKLLAALTV